MKQMVPFKKGIRDGIPIGLGYFAVAFAVGIAAQKAGMSIWSATVMSMTNVTSAGEAAGIGLIAVFASYGEMALTQLVINLRYMLMSCALSQKFAPDMKWYHRLFVAFGVTDEIFAISATYPGDLPPAYPYGAMLVAVPGWTLGTLLGAWVGNILPATIGNALSVCLYGMFIAIVVPPASKNRAVLITALSAMVLSVGMTYLPGLCRISSGFRIIIITVLVSAVMAVVAPIPQEQEETEEGQTDEG